MIFKKPKNRIEGHDTYEGLVDCMQCKKSLYTSDIANSYNVCIYCGYHFRLNARQRLDMICDEDSFVETDKEMRSFNILSFPEYDKKLNNARLASAEVDAVVCGTCKLNGNPAAIFVMEPYFMMGSMGVVVGEKLTRLFEKACEECLPVVGFTVSGGARMQEGILSLMQMAKVSGAVKKHSDLGNFYLCVLTDPTTGGVTASFAMEADIILAEPFAHIGFAGQRVIEQTIRKKLPEGFQKAEFLLERGFVDDIVPRSRQKKYIGHLVRFHSGSVAQ